MFLKICGFKKLLVPCIAAEEAKHYCKISVPSQLDLEVCSDLENYKTRQSKLQHVVIREYLTLSVLDLNSSNL